MNKYSSYILYLLITLLIAVLSFNDIAHFDSLQRWIDDTLCRITASENSSPNIVIVSVDGPALDEYGAWPWNQDLVADLLAAVGGGEPKCIVADFDFSDDAVQDSAGYTNILAGQLNWIKNVVLPYDIALTTFRNDKTNNPDHLFDHSLAVNNKLGVISENSSLLARKVFLPSEKILDSKPLLGFDYIMPGQDRVLRYQPLVVHYEGFYYPSVALMAASAYLGVPASNVTVIENESIHVGGERIIPIREQSEYFINFPAGNSYVRYSAAEVLGNNFDFNRFKNKMVLVGVDDPLLGETYLTTTGDEAPKLLVTAAAIDNIISDNFITVRNDRPAQTMFILILLGAAFAFVLPQVSLINRMFILALGFFVLANVNYFMVSAFRVITDTVYFGFELFLFMLASPLVDSEFLAGTKKDTAVPVRAKLPKIDVAPRTVIHEQPPVREIGNTSSDSVAVPTSMLGFPEEKVSDHQAISLDSGKVNKAGGIGALATTQAGPGLEDGATQSAPQGAAAQDKPEIISPSKPGKTKAAQRPPDVKPASSPSIGHESGPIAIKNLGRYQVVGTLGKGAMGHVYKGVDPAINRPVALKTIRLDFVNDPAEMEELKERLFREAQAAGKLSHPNIVTVYDVGSEGHLQYIAMEYLEGQTLEELIKRKAKFNFRIIAQIIVQICMALDYAHQRGIVHRDIKPANIMILKDYSAKVMDYGIARIDSNSMTKTGIAMGTPNYISPEQLQGKEIDHCADLFSLGVVMYEMLLGKRPFKGENITSLIYSILNHEPEKPSDVNPQIPLLFDHIVAKCLKKDARDRYQGAKEVCADLSDFVESFAAKS
ncbi:MAG: protein kinase [Candidatus Zixiibacteriota bacterium]